MPALSLQAPSLVQQKVYQMLYTTASTKTRLWWETARGFFNQWQSSGGNADLQFIPFAEADADAAGGTNLVNEACQVYMFYVSKLASATANTVKLFDDATDDATAADQAQDITLSAASQEAMLVFPTGFDMADGVVITQHTTPEGTTDGSDGGDGFIVVGAA